MSKPLIIVISGPGGAGKGTLVDALLERDTALWLSRSWTTRTQREGEPDDAYVFVSRDQFHRRIGDKGFLEWTEFLGNLYGSPIPDDDIGNDIVLEIELHGAKQVKEQHPEALLVFVMPPTRQEQERRLQERGDPYRHVMQRLKKAESEEREGTALADVVIINDDLERAVAELVLAIGVARRSRG